MTVVPPSPAPPSRGPRCAHAFHRPRPRSVAIGALALLLVAAPFVPRGGGNDGSLLPSGDETGALAAADTAGAGTLTPALQAEIDRVVAEGRTAGRVSARTTPGRLAADLVRCADFEGQRYCLGSGWTTDSQSEVQARTAAAARTVSARRTATATDTGDLDALGTLRRNAALSPAARAAAERAELTAAARSVAKVWLLRHEIEGVALPAGFLARHPEARATTTASGTAPPGRRRPRRRRSRSASTTTRAAPR